MRSRKSTAKQGGKNQISSQQRLFNASKQVLMTPPASTPVNPLATPLYAIDAYASLQQSAIPDFPYSLPMPHTFKNTSNDDLTETLDISWDDSSNDSLSEKHTTSPQP